MAQRSRNVTAESRRGRGRPAIDDGVTILVRLPAPMVEAIKAVAGPRRRGEFIRAAIEREIERRRRSI